MPDNLIEEPLEAVAARLDKVLFEPAEGVFLGHGGDDAPRVVGRERVEEPEKVAVAAVDGCLRVAVAWVDTRYAM
jgi:hypothetical protein